MPLFIVDVLHRGPGMAGLALATFAVGNVSAVIPSGYLSDRVGRRLLLIVGGNCLLFRPNQYLRSVLPVVVGPAGQFDGIERLLSGVGDDETSDAIVVASLR